MTYRHTLILLLSLTCSCSNRVDERIIAMPDDDLKEYIAEHPSGKLAGKARQELGRRAFLRLQAEARTAPAKKSTLGVEVRWGFDTISIKNVTSPDAVGRTMTVYLNATPPFTFKAKWLVPAVGETAEIPLRAFVKKDGTRFDPRTRAVTEAWLGGDGYDYQQYH